MKYTIIHPFDAAKLKGESTFSYIIEFNMSKVYTLANSKILVVPLNPFATSMLIDNKTVLKEFIDKQCFPIEEELKGFYFENREKIDNLLQYKKRILDQLIGYVDGGQDLNRFEKVTLEKIAEIYHFVKKKRSYKKYKLSLIILLGDYLIENLKDRSLQWALLANKQYLNPIKKLVLTDCLIKGNYLNIEDISTNAFKTDDIEYFMKNIEMYIKKANEIEAIIKVF